MSEHEEQVTLFQWADLYSTWYPELQLLFAIPNGAKLPYRRDGKKRVTPQGLRLKKEGMKKGVPDICLPVARKGWHGLYIELKFDKNRPTPEQEWWLNRLTENGYLAVAAWGFEEAKDVIVEYLEMKV